jgi:pyridoxamine 5'-phosphate oxidase
MTEWCFADNLSDIDIHCWRLLHEGVHSYKNPFHFGVLTSMEDQFPAARTVIIRGVDIDNRVIQFNTDIRSPKFAQLSVNPNISWLFYDEGLRIQMRCRGIATLHTNDKIAEKGWTDARLNCKITYMSPHAPGTLLEEPYLLDLNRAEITEEELLSARSHFSIVQTKIISLDWAFLHHRGNRRAYFDYLQKKHSWMQT